MPSKTPRQARAMAAAAAGRSTLGIPKKVGKEFVKADKAKVKRKKSTVKRKRPKQTPKANNRRRRPMGTGGMGG